MNTMKTIDLNGITYIEPVPGGTPDWYYGIGREHGDLYEAEELYPSGRPVKGNGLYFVRYPEGEAFRVSSEEPGTYYDTPVFLEDGIFFLQADFPKGRIRILRFDCREHEITLVQELSLDTVKDCYNLQLHTSPLCLTRQGGEGVFEILWPERVCFDMDPHESFFLRDNERLFFSRWHEEGTGSDYRYWEDTVIRDLSGNIAEVMPGDISVMPNGEKWHLV